MSDNDEFGQAIHALLRELGWSHGELTPSLVHQALAQVHHLRKQAGEADRLRRVVEVIDASGSAVCQACGVEWWNHNKTCGGSVVEKP